MSACSISATGCPVSIAVELATARMMRALSGSALEFSRSRKRLREFIAEGMAAGWAQP